MKNMRIKKVLNNNVVIAEDVITYASKEKGLELNELIHITLTDHIDGVPTRLKKGISLSNQLTMEISRVYDTEFQIGLYAVNLLREKTGCEVLRDEAAFVAMHFLNNRMDLASIEQEVRTVLKFVYDTVVSAYPEPARCTEKVVKVFALKYKKERSTEEKAYLTLYIEKLNRE